jgi:hypothetical protein
MEIRERHDEGDYGYKFWGKNTHFVTLQVRVFFVKFHFEGLMDPLGKIAVD